MKTPKPSNLRINHRLTKQIREKITINIDQDSLNALKLLAEKNGASYQKLLNQILREGLKKTDLDESRLDRIEKEIEKLKRKVA